MHQVLISYSSKDKKWADAACSVLESRGIRCWIAPRDIAPGTEWGAAIIGGIDACRVMVLIFSSSANASPQVRREVERAISKGLAIIPCRIEDVKPQGAMEYALGNTHWLDVFTPPVENQLNRLTDSVAALLPDDSGVSKTAISLPVVPAAATPQDEICRSSRRRLFVVIAVSLAIVFWPRKNAASVASTADSTAPTANRVDSKPVADKGRDNPVAQAAPAQSMRVERPLSSPPSAERGKVAHASFVPLFDGKSLSGWVVEHQPPRAHAPPPPRGKKHPGGKGHPAPSPRWTVDDDGAILVKGDTINNRNYLLTEREYSDFVLKLEYSLADDAISAVVIRAIPPKSRFMAQEANSLTIRC